MIDEEICCICHENLISEETYKLPECKHNFHTNCICTWFRAGHNSCPLCNNNGVNSYNSNCWNSWEDAYKVNRRHSRKKGAPIALKRLVNKLKKFETVLKEHRKKMKDYNNSIQNIKVREIKKKHTYLRRRRWKIVRKIKAKKRQIAFQNLITIIIPKNVIIN